MTVKTEQLLQFIDAGAYLRLGTPITCVTGVIVNVTGIAPNPLPPSSSSFSALDIVGTVGTRTFRPGLSNLLCMSMYAFIASTFFIFCTIDTAQTVFY